MGKGYEDSSIYKNTDVVWCPIENIHVMRDSFAKLSDCTPRLVHYICTVFLIRVHVLYSTIRTSAAVTFRQLV